jgi:hypothetical protein
VKTTDTTIVVRRMHWQMGRTEAGGAQSSELRDIAQIPLELQHVLQLVQDLVMVGTEAAGVAIALGNSEAMHCVSSVGEAPPVNIPVQLNGTLSGHCVRTGKIVSRRPSRKLAMHHGQRSVLLAPVFLHSSVVGLIGVFFTDATPFDTAACRAVIRHAARMIELCMSKLEGVPKPLSTCEIGWGTPLLLNGMRLTAAGPMTASSASHANTPSPKRARHLLGLPCRVCGTYLFTDEVVCRVCKTANGSQLNSVA